MKYFCYLIKSEQKPTSTSTYIGFSVNPFRRLRQHNGEIKAGAYKTSKKRPWTHIVIVEGFPNKIVALQFEWQWQNPLRTRILKEKRTNEKSHRYGWSYKDKLNVLYSLLESDLWSQLGLTLYFSQLDAYKYFHSLVQSRSLKNVSIIQSFNIKTLHQDADAEEIVIESANVSCRICDASNVQAPNKKLWRCPFCRCFQHVLCSAQSAAQANHKLIPQRASCHGCGEVFPWYEVIRRQVHVDSIDDSFSGQSQSLSQLRIPESALNKEETLEEKEEFKYPQEEAEEVCQDEQSFLGLSDDDMDVLPCGDP